MIRVFFLSMTILAFVASPVHAGALEFFFPSLKKKEPNPYETLRAPFAEGAEEGGEKVELPINAIPLEKPHRVSAEITQWVMEATSEVMNFDGRNNRAALDAHSAMFDTTGFGQYTGFLQQSNIIKVLDTGKFRVRSYVEDTPLLVNEGAVGASYRWLYQVPVVISYIDVNANSYEDIEPVNQRVKLNVQVGRQPQADNPHGILIESWAGKVSAFDKK